MTDLSRRDVSLLLGLGLFGFAMPSFAAGSGKGATAATPLRPKLDHIVWAVPDLDEGIRYFAELTGVTPVSGGRAPGRPASHNALASLGDGVYLEVFAPNRVMTSGPWLDRVKARSEPQIVAYCLRVEDEFAALQKQSVAAGVTGTGPRAMGRVRPDGVALNWKLYNIASPVAGEALPFFIDWQGSPHPSQDSPHGVRLARFAVGHPEPQEIERIFRILQIDLPVDAAERPSFSAALETPKGKVVLRG